MASKNMTTIMSLYITLNLVLLGFASAQPLVCSIDLQQLQVCVQALQNITGILDQQGLNRCCTLLTSVDARTATVCLCDAIKGITTSSPINVVVSALLNRCRLPPQSGLVTCN